MNFRLFVPLLLLCIALPFSYVHAQEVVRENTISAVCGNIIEAEFTNNFSEHSYAIHLDPGSSLQVSARPLGGGLMIGTFITGPTNLVITVSEGDYNTNYVNRIMPQAEPTIVTESLGSRGRHTIRVVNFQVEEYRPTDDIYRSLDNRYAAGVGVYTLFIGCTLPDGTVVEPGDNVSMGENLPVIEPTATPGVDYSVFGFPGVNPVDFSQGIEIPLTVGQSLPVPIGNDVALYTYTTTANSTASLRISRLGDSEVSLGVAVIHQDTNEIIFFGGMPHSNNLSVELNFPSDGTYAIGLFRLDTPTLSGTSGAVQITIE